MKTPKRASPDGGEGRRPFLNGGIPSVRSVALALALTAGLAGCASQTIEADSDAPVEVLPKNVPSYAAVPQPVGLQMADVRAIFSEPGAPRLDSDEMKSCSSDYRAVEAKTKSREEQKQAILELVRKEPVRYHWCFYATLLNLESSLRQAQMLDERQKTVIEAYRFLAPLARVFQQEYRDSRYLRWAVYYYRHASEVAFYRRVEASPELTQELIGVGHEDDPNRGVSEESTSVLHKYGIVVPERLQPGQAPESVGAGELLPDDAFVKAEDGGAKSGPRSSLGSEDAARAPAADSSSGSGGSTSFSARESGR